MNPSPRGVEQLQFLCMHSLGRELIVTEMHQSPVRLHVRDSRSSARRRDDQRPAPTLQASADPRDKFF
jgi:hypothetical protein